MVRSAGSESRVRQAIDAAASIMRDELARVGVMLDTARLESDPVGWTLSVEHDASTPNVHGYELHHALQKLQELIEKSSGELVAVLLD